MVDKDNTKNILSNDLAKTIAGQISQEQQGAANGVSISEQDLLKFFFEHSDDRLIQYAKEHPEHPLIRNELGQGMFHVGDISFIKSQVGNGKTYACSLVSVAGLGFAHNFGLDSNGDCRVFYFDTEMSDNRTAVFINRVRKMTNNDPRFHAGNINHTLVRAGLSLNEDNKVELIKAVIKKHEAETMKNVPALIIVDGIAQLFNDTNSNTEAQKFFENLAAFTSEHPIHFLSVLHENQGYVGGKMGGHVGSYGFKFAREVYRVKRDKDIFTLSCKSGVEGMKYTYGKEQPDINWKLKDDILVPPTFDEIQHIGTSYKGASDADLSILHKIFDGTTEGLRRVDIINRFLNEKPNLTDSGARNFIDRNIDKCSLRKEGEGKNTRYFLNV